jgi:hypothetical protein
LFSFLKLIRLYTIRLKDNAILHDKIELGSCLRRAGTLDGGNIDGDGKLTVLDIDHIIA